MFIFHFKKVLTIHRLNVFSILKLQKHSFWHKLKTRLGALLLLKLFSPAITDGLRQEPLIFSVSGARNLLASLCNIMWIFSWLIQQDFWKKKQEVRSKIYKNIRKKKTTLMENSCTWKESTVPYWSSYWFSPPPPWTTVLDKLSIV